MTLSLAEQARIASTARDFIQRIDAAAFNAAVTQFLAAANPDPAIQAKRLILVNKILLDSSFENNVFAWVCVSRSNINQESDLTDAFLLSTCVSNFDTIAQQVLA